MNDLFRRFASRVSHMVGTAWAFGAAFLVVVGWFVIGLFIGFSTEWHLIINAITAIATFLMVFLIQNTQNRDAKALHLKLDELIKHTKRARNAIIDLEDASDEELARLEAEFKKLRNRQHPG